jgi:hypothetical protein
MALILKGLLSFTSSQIITNLPENWPPVSNGSIRFHPAARSRVVIRLAENTKAKPNANTRTLRPDKCLVVSSLSPGLRPGFPRNTVANAATTRDGSRH